MDPHEELFAEDQNVEITDLPGHERAGPAAHRPRSRTAAQSLWRRRSFQLAALVLLSLFSVALLLRGIPGVGSSVLSGVFGPAPPPATLTRLNTNLFYVNKGPSWAQLIIDGQRIEHVPVAGREPPLRLSPGSHHVLWRASPFPSQTCVVSVPASPMDTCAATETTLAPDGRLSRIISFLASLASLTPTERTNLIATISRELAHLQSNDTVYPGEQFVGAANNSGGLIVTARQTLQATLSLILDTNQAGREHSCTGGDTIKSCTLHGQDCHALCTREENVNTNPVWEVVALVQSSWTYTSLDGRVVAAQMADAPGKAALVEHFLPLDVTWDGTNWHARAVQDFLNGPISCVAAQDNDTIGNFFGSSPWQTFGWNYMPAANRATGCLLALTSIVYGGPSPAARPLILYLHRFGVFIAINRLAQEYSPEMPRPTAYEMSLVQEIMAKAHLST